MAADQKSPEVLCVDAFSVLNIKGGFNLKSYIKKFSSIAFILILLISLSACNTATSGGNNAKDDNVIKIGAIFAETGPASTLGKTQVNLVKLLQKQLDEQGKIKGKKIEIVMQDYETDDTKAVVAADKLISDG